MFRRAAEGSEREKLRAGNRRSIRDEPALRPSPIASAPTPLPLIGAAVPASRTIRPPRSATEAVILRRRRAANSDCLVRDPGSAPALTVATAATRARNAGLARTPRETYPQ